MTELGAIFEKNMERVEGITKLYSSLKDDNHRYTKEYLLTDMLRAATVFLHSSFEEYFRSMLIQWLPIKADENTLKSIPIALHAGNKHVDKIYLNDLSKYRNMTIDEVLRQSVEEHMKLKSFNSQEDIRIWLSKIEINVDECTGFKEIDKAIKRRHKIVHEADTNKSETKERLSSIKPNEVTKWIISYKQLVTIIDRQIEKWEKKDEQTNS